MDRGEGTVSACREGRSPDPDLATAAAPWPQRLPTNGPHMASALKLVWEKPVLWEQPLALAVLLQPRGGSGWLLWFGSLPLPGKEGGTYHWGRHCVARGCGHTAGRRGMQANKGFRVVPSYPPALP